MSYEVRAQNFRPDSKTHHSVVRGQLGPNSKCLALIIWRNSELGPNSLPNRNRPPLSYEVIL